MSAGSTRGRSAPVGVVHGVAVYHAPQWRLRVTLALLWMGMGMAMGTALENNKYRTSKPLNIEEVLLGRDASEFSRHSECHIDVDLLWRSSVSGELYSTPVITDLDRDGKKEVVVVTSSHYVEAVQHNGQRVQGWPFAFPESQFAASPLLYDVNQDGINEVVVTTENGEVVFLSFEGIPLYGQALKVPPLKVRKDWYEGLEGQGIDASFKLSAAQPEQMHKEDVSQQTSATAAKPFPQQAAIGGDETDDTFKGMEGWLTEEGIKSLELFLVNSNQPNILSTTQQDPLSSTMFEHYLNFSQPKQSKEFLLVDAHVLATPVIADLDADGNDEIILSVSYYFDPRVYNEPTKRGDLPLTVDISKYVAGGIVVFDLATHQIKFITNFDLTTDSTKYAGYIYASPTVLDVNSDGKLEIVVGTGVGFIHMIDHQGRSINDAFPLIMDSIYAQIVVEDVNNDGALEIIGCDTNSNIVCFNLDGEELWESRLFGYPNQPPTLADVNLDGVLDIVVATSEGYIWALRGDTGESLPNFPVKLQGRVHSQPLVLHLDPTQESLQILVAAFDGYVYVINGGSACFDKVDLGETSYSMILADDMTGNGKLDLLIATRNGNMYLFGTEAPYHPLNTWTSQLQGRNGFTLRKGNQGIYFLDNPEIIGGSMSVQFEIVDMRRTHKRDPMYQVAISFGDIHLFSNIYTKPGVYSEYFPCLFVQSSALIEIEMTNENQQAFFDSVMVSFNVNFRLLKWLISAPFMLMVAVLVFLQRSPSVLPLPTNKMNVH